MNPPTVSIERSGAKAMVTLAGSLVVGSVDAVLGELAGVTGPGEVVVNLAALERFDTAGAWAVLSLQRRLAADGVSMRIEGASEARLALLATVESSLPPGAAPPRPHRTFVDWVATV